MSDATTDRPPAADVLALVRSDRVSAELRRELLKRAEPDDPAYAPRTMTAKQFAALRALVDRVVPQDGPEQIDLAARLDATMAAATGNGWRYEALPTDPDAYNLGLDTLDAVSFAGHGALFAALSDAERDDILEGLAAGRPTAAPNAPFDAAQMALWFEEVRTDTVRLYVAHPATMARLGYSGIANGAGAGAAFTGFGRIGIGEREAFEPEPRRPEPIR